MLYPVVEIFKSIQGEGRYTGYPANFIRLAGCPNLCKFCDTDLEAHEALTEGAIARRLDPALLITVVTGGEPCIHSLQSLTDAIRKVTRNHRIHLETSGVRKLSGQFDWVAVSPKRKTKFIMDVLQEADEIKWLYPMWDVEDICHILRNWEFQPTVCNFLQPINYKRRLNMKNVQGAVDAILQHECPITLRLSVQLHKIIKVR